MSSDEEETELELDKQRDKQLGLRLFLIAVALLAVAFVMYSSGLGGAIYGLVVLGFIGCLISSNFYLAYAWFGKT